MISSIIIAGISNFIFNFRVFIESLVVAIAEQEGHTKYWKYIFKNKKDKEKYRSSVSIKVNGRGYRVIEFAEYKFDPRARDKNDLKGFLIFSEENENEIIEDNIKKKVLGVYLFWRHIYFENILGDIQLKPHSKRIFKYQQKFQEAFLSQIENRRKKGYGEIAKIKNKNFAEILKNLDDEVYNQSPFVNEKLKIQISIFDSLYSLFTKPSDVSYNSLISKIENLSKLSEDENKTWNKRLATWRKLVNHYDLKIEEMPKPNFKKVGLSVSIDIIKHLLSKNEAIMSEETIEELLIEGTKIPKKKVLKFLNNYFVLHKTGIDAINFNIKVNRKFLELARDSNNILKNPPIEKIRN